jgi:hypothetical protein
LRPLDEQLGGRRRRRQDGGMLYITAHDPDGNTVTYSAPAS